MSSSMDNGNRELLSQAIVDALATWPDLHRRVFIKAHYESRSAEQIAESVGLKVGDVTSILNLCSTRLHKALKFFRANGCSLGMNEFSVEAQVSA